MVEEIVRVEPQLFGSQVQQTSIARKMELWRRIVDRVKAVGQHPRTQDDIRKRLNDLRGKETMDTVLGKFQEAQRLQEEHYLGIREDLKSINTTLVTIAGVLADLLNTRRDTVAHQRTPDTSLDDEQPSTSAGASGQEAPT
ncbi:hypothetical protein NDU88_005815 [Pleurodeles waltl]|uniref:Myb/SANT-like DNA-binding domain-containing protein n=1 Tax=Pleurodeles waltl TaxID=8319 RepID=A0AAV7TXN3_PLEWA|nr:hypothetical protein NDU88_005815 [Pleurodeles waltl]